MLIKKQMGKDHTERRAQEVNDSGKTSKPGESGWLRLRLHEKLRCYSLHGLEQSLSVVLEGHDQLQLGASGFHG